MSSWQHEEVQMKAQRPSVGVSLDTASADNVLAARQNPGVPGWVPGCTRKLEHGAWIIRLDDDARGVLD